MHVSLPKAAALYLSIHPAIYTLRSLFFFLLSQLLSFHCSPPLHLSLFALSLSTRPQANTTGSLPKRQQSCSRKYPAAQNGKSPLQASVYHWRHFEGILVSLYYLVLLIQFVIHILLSWNEPWGRLFPEHCIGVCLCIKPLKAVIQERSKIFFFFFSTM